LANRAEKEKVVEELTEKFKRSVSVIMTDYRGLNVAEITELRRKLRNSGVDYQVVKNTLARLAAEKVGIEGLEKYLGGPTALAFGYEDPVIPAKELAAFAREHDDLEIKAGIVDGRVIGRDMVKELASLPTREELLAKLLSAMQAPLVGMLNVLLGPMRGFVHVVDGLRKEKEAEAS